MVRRSLIVAVLLAVSSPLAAQEQYVWSSDRPDADAPLGVIGARTLDANSTDISYRFSQFNSRGVWFAKDSLPLATTLQLYDTAPLTLSQQTHTVMVSRGITDQLTIMATGEFSVFEREQLRSDGMLFITRVKALGDLTATALYEVYRQGPYRMNVSLGALIPVGKSRTWACTAYSVQPCDNDANSAAQDALPYDQRPGGGTFAIMPGASGQVQNEFGSAGAQFRARIYVGDGVTDYSPGDRYEANGWAAVRLNDALSVSAGIRWATWGRIEGADPYLDPTRDPGNDPVTGMVGGQEADLPVGINFVMPEGSPLAGHRFAVEAVYALHHDYEGVRLGLDWAINLAWTMGVGF